MGVLRIYGHAPRDSPENSLPVMSATRSGRREGLMLLGDDLHCAALAAIYARKRRNVARVVNLVEDLVVNCGLCYIFGVFVQMG